MNVDTGEYQVMTDEEVRRANEIAGRDLWVRKSAPKDVSPINGYYSSRAERRKAMRKGQK